VARHEYEDDEPYVVIEKHSGDFGSFILGAALGAGIALLLAPKSGVQTRRELRKQVKRARSAAEDMVQGVTERVSDRFETAKTGVENRLDAARDAVELKKEQVAQAIDVGRVAAPPARADLERRIAETKASYQASADARRGSQTGS
jgi:gas vesicle protein